MNKVFRLIFFLLFFGCTSGETFVSKAAFLIQPEEMPLVGLAVGFEPKVENIEYVALETNSSSIIESPISGLVFTDDRIVCTDRNLQQVFIFDRGGNFINKIAANGRGKGEYLHISAFTVNNLDEQVLIYDGFAGKILTYSVDGDFVDESQIKFKGQSIGLFCDQMVYQQSTELIYFYTAAQQKPEISKILGGDFDLIITDENYNIVSTQFPKNRIEHPLLERPNQLQAHKDHVYFAPPLSNTIYKFSGLNTSEQYIEVACNMRQMQDEVAAILTSLAGEPIKLGVSEKLGNAWPIQDFIIGQEWSVIIAKYYKEIYLLNNNSGKATRIEANRYNYSDVSPEKGRLDIFSPLRPYITPDDYFVSISEAENVRTRKDDFKNKVKQIEAFQHIPDVQDSDNPVLILYKLSAK